MNRLAKTDQLKGTRETRGTIRLGMKKVKVKGAILLVALLSVLAIVIPRVHAITIKDPFVIAHRLPDEANPLRCNKGNALQVGDLLLNGESFIRKLAVRKHDRGLLLGSSPIKISKNSNELCLLVLVPPFDANISLDIWRLRARDERRNEIAAKTHRSDRAVIMPYVENIEASGNPLVPTTTWSGPKRGDYLPECKITNQVRLFETNGSEFYRTNGVIYHKNHKIAEEFSRYEDISDTHVRIRYLCRDKDEKDHPLAVELRPRMFRPYKGHWANESAKDAGM